jgi:hypothetical protein
VANGAQGTVGKQLAYSFSGQKKNGDEIADDEDDDAVRTSVS